MNNREPQPEPQPAPEKKPAMPDEFRSQTNKPAKIPENAKSKLVTQRNLGKPKKFFIPYPTRLKRDQKKAAQKSKKFRDLVQSFPDVLAEKEVPKRTGFDSPIRKLEGMARSKKSGAGTGNQLNLMRNAMALKSQKDQKIQEKAGPAKKTGSTSKLTPYESPKKILNSNKNQSTKQ